MRLDALFNDPRNWLFDKSKFPELHIKDLLVSWFSGGTPTSSEAANWNGDILWASPKDFSDEIVIADTQDRITEAGRNTAKLKFAQQGTVLLVVRSGILKHTLPVMVCGREMTVNQDVKALVLKPDISPLFFAEYLQVYQSRILPLITKHGTTVQSINTNEFERLLIPLPPLDIQRALVAEMEAARESRRAKLDQADELLKSIDGWLLAQLEIAIPPQSEHKVFAARLGEAKGRVDVAFHSPRFRAIRESIEHGKYPARTVGSFCISIKSGFAAGKQDQAENEVDGVPHLRPLNLSIYGDLSLKGTKYVPRTSLTANDLCQQGEVLFNNTNSEELVGKSTVFDLDVDCACSNHMTRLELTPDASPYFIATLFNALRSTGYIGMLATNFVNQAGVNADTLAALRVPFPTLDIQQTILSEVSRRRAEARRLRAEAEAEWQAAKEHFEHQLLAGGTA